MSSRESDFLLSVDRATLEEAEADDRMEEEREENPEDVVEVGAALASVVN